MASCHRAKERNKKKNRILIGVPLKKTKGLFTTTLPTQFIELRAVNYNDMDLFIEYITARLGLLYDSYVTNLANQPANQTAFLPPNNPPTLPPSRPTHLLPMPAAGLPLSLPAAAPTLPTLSCLPALQPTHQPSLPEPVSPLTRPPAPPYRAARPT